MARHRPRVNVELLEERALLTTPAGIPGVTLGSYGVLSIVGTQNSGNVASVTSVPANSTIHVALNGQSEDLSASDVTTIIYIGGFGGHDTFTNQTSLMSIEYGFGGGNTFTGGTGTDFFFMFGDGNTVHKSSGFGVAFTHQGNDSIDAGLLVF